jgi:hypothetical protein
MMRIAWSEKYIKGPGRVAGVLPMPPCDYANYQNLTKTYPHIHESVPPEKRFYQDVAVLAYRMAPDAARAAALWPPKLICSDATEKPEKAIDGDGATALSINANGFLQFDFGEPVIIRGVEYLGVACELQASDDGKAWRKVADLPGPRMWGYPQTLPVPETRARHFRVLSTVGGSIADIKISGDSFVQDYQPKASFNGVWTDIKTAEDRIGAPTPNWAKETIQAKDVLNLTDRLQSDGTLDWNAPDGDWMVVRIGCAPTGRLNGPGAREFVGLECNKLDAEAVEYHFNSCAGRAADELKDLIGTGFHFVHLDSWEAGDLNFTPKFVEEFKKRRGYDPTPYLLVHGGGRVVDGPAIADRFLWDVRRTIADLLADNYFGKMNALCHKRGLKFQGEIAGVMSQTTVDQLQAKGRCDLPMGEFQMPNCVYGDDWARSDARETTSGAHIYGKSIASAEAFTTFDRWMTDPYALKGIGDLAFAMGINRLVFHTWAHQPWLDRAPGMTMGPFGVNFSRTNTWWGRPAKAYIDYLRRCQSMLQQGRYVADILYFYGDGAPNMLPAKPFIRPAMPDGYSYDGCDAATLLSRVEARDGRLALPDGMSYRMLVLKEDHRMTPEVLAKVKELVKAGATVIGPKPTESPSLCGYPKCDERVRQLADEVWGNVDSKGTIDRRFGDGRIVWKTAVADVLKSMEIDADVEIVKNKHENPIEWLHRSTGDAEIYFLSNQKNIIDHGASLEIWERRYKAFAINEAEKDTACIDVGFRVTQKQPELWDATNDTRRDLPAFREEKGRTIVPLELPPSGSCFVVFRKTRPSHSKQIDSKNFPAMRKTAEIAGPWSVVFDPKWGGPAQITFKTLDDWTARPEPGIKYYSGRATYKTVFDAAETIRTPGNRVYLDLGSLRSIAEVRLNGTDLGVLWCPPWRVDITGQLKPTGNLLEIDIVNLWANRVIGDAVLPKAKRVTWTSLSDTIMALKPDSRLVPSGLRGPVLLYTTKP